MTNTASSHTSASANALRSLRVAGRKTPRPERQPHPAIEWREADGSRRLTPAAQAAGMAFEDHEPVRGAPAFKGQWSKPGRYWFSRTGLHVPYESRFEMQHLMLLDHDARTVAVAWQPFRAHFGTDRKPYSHVPDLFVRRADGTALVIDVKGALAAGREDNRRVFALTARVCAQAGLDYRVASEIAPVLLANITWLAGYRRRPPQATADLAGAVLDAAASGRGLTRVVDAAAAATGAHPAALRPVLFHLLWTGDLLIDHDKPLSDATAIRLARQPLTLGGNA